jgi:hypothetical protein
LILTGARLREILDTQREHVDIERGVIFLADSKTGRKPDYLTAAAVEVPSGLSRIEGKSNALNVKSIGSFMSFLTSRGMKSLCSNRRSRDNTRGSFEGSETHFGTAGSR